MSLINKSIFLLILLSLIHFGHDAYAANRRAIDFNLKNFDDKILTLQVLESRVTVLTFSYAFCSVRCPIITGRFSSLDRSMNAPQNVVYLHVSVDPPMDTPENRKKYFSLYGIDTVKDKRWMFVSGQEAELSKLWRFYGITVKKIESKGIPEGYYMEYTPKVVVIGRDGLIVYETDFFFNEDEIAKRIRGTR